MKVIKFDKDYNNKSNLDIFPTIRDKRKGEIGEIVLCKFPDKEFKARIVNCYWINFVKWYSGLEWDLFFIDTGLTSDKEVRKLFEKFYPGKTELCLHLLKKVKD